MELRFTSRRAVSWRFLSLLDVPDPAGFSAGPARVVSLPGVHSFDFLRKIQNAQECGII